MKEMKRKAMKRKNMKQIVENATNMNDNETTNKEPQAKRNK